MIKRILKIMGISMIFAFPPLNFGQIYDDISYFLNEKRDSIIINSPQNLTIRSTFEGIIENVAMKAGDKVKQGDILLIFDKNELITQKQLLLTRIGKLKPQEMQTEAINEARLQLHSINNQIETSVIRAPEDGKIVRVFYHPGQYVSKGDELFAIRYDKRAKTLAMTPKTY